MNRENLQILADFLKKFAAGETDVKAKFDMGIFNNGGGDFGTDCGTAGCAVGFAPFAGIRKRMTEPWERYARRVFGFEFGSVEFEWCFSGLWSDADNTPLGAAKRIEILLNAGLPENWEDQIDGNAPLQYEL